MIASESRASIQHFGLVGVAWMAPASEAVLYGDFLCSAQSYMVPKYHPSIMGWILATLSSPGTAVAIELFKREKPMVTDSSYGNRLGL
jgi:uncharacterized membrane protein